MRSRPGRDCTDQFPELAPLAEQLRGRNVLLDGELVCLASEGKPDFQRLRARLWGKRSVPLSLAAEIQHRLLPGAYTCEAGQFTLAGWLEPAGNVGGDTFDLAVDRDTLHLSMTDAMGHTVQAAVLATVLVGALRNARRAGVDLAEQAQRANAALCEFARRGEFVTGQVRAHPPEHRNGGNRQRGSSPTAAAARRTCRGAEPAPRSAVRDRARPRLPGAAVAASTGRPADVPPDGMLDRNASGVDIDAALIAGMDMHPREAVQHLVAAVLRATDGDLEDDATVMCLDWHGGPPRNRTTDSGANH